MIVYTCKIVLRSDHTRKNGTKALVLQAFIGGTRVRIPLHLHVRPEEFDENKMLVKIKGDPDRTQKINAVLTKMRSRAEDMFFEARMNDMPLTASAFEESFDARPSMGDFLVWMEQEIGKEKADKKDATVRGYYSTLNWLRKFREKVAFADVNFEFVQEFDRFLKKRKLENNSIAKYHRGLRKFVLLARKKRKRMPNPYADFKFREVQTERTYLTADEVNTLLGLYHEGSMREFLRDTLRHFLFQVGTSVRYSDLKRLKHDDVVGGMLVFSPTKTSNTGKVVKVPLSEMAKEMLKETESAGPTLFKVPVEQIMNRRLKEITELVGFSKKLTTHVGRHTFGYLFIAAGGTVEVLQKIMGHADIKTTMVYTHIDSKQIRGGVAQLDAFLKVK